MQFKRVLKSVRLRKLTTKTLKKLTATNQNATAHAFTANLPPKQKTEKLPRLQKRRLLNQKLLKQNNFRSLTF